MLQGLRKAGEYIAIAGAVATFGMAIVGTIAIDIVIAAYVLKKAKEENSWFSGFLTGYFLSSMFSNNNISNPANYVLMLLASPFLTGVAIGLSFLLGVPQVGIALALGWGIALSVVGIGTGIIALADKLSEQFPDNPPPHPVEGLGISDEYPYGSGYSDRPRRRSSSSPAFFAAEAEAGVPIPVVEVEIVDDSQASAPAFTANTANTAKF